MRIRDISVLVSPITPKWPGDPPTRLRRFLDQENGDPANATEVSCSAHIGTHIDAPIHTLPRGAAAESTPLDACIGSAHVLDLGHVETITAQGLQVAWPRERVERVLFKTRNSRLWHNETKFAEDFVALAPDAAQFLVDHGVRLVGIDYLSVQRFRDPTPDTHRILLGAGVVVLEGIDLSQVEAGKYVLLCLPWKLSGSDGAPSRAVLLDDTSQVEGLV